MSIEIKTTPSSLEVVIWLALIGVFIYSLCWVYDDARRVGKPGWLVTLIVFFGAWPISLLAWLVFRTDHLPAPPKEETIKCFKCQSLIPEGQSECGQCGWSYKRRDT